VILSAPGDVLPVRIVAYRASSKETSGGSGIDRGGDTGVQGTPLIIQAKPVMVLHASPSVGYRRLGSMNVI
jgi:hypothetical protein